MAHTAQFNFVTSVQKRFPTLFRNKKILEIGSLNINGTVRHLFSDCQYIGVDLDYGRDVDLVCEGQNLKFADNFFNVAISCECFEHNPYWDETFVNMTRMASDLVIMTCATTGRPEHGTSRSSIAESPFTTEWDYYKNLTEEDFYEALDMSSLFRVWEFETNVDAKDLYFWGLPHPL